MIEKEALSVKGYMEKLRGRKGRPAIELHNLKNKEKNYLEVICSPLFLRSCQSHLCAALIMLHAHYEAMHI